MKKHPLFASTLIAASFTLSVPVLATDLPASGGASAGGPTADDNYVIATGDYAIASGESQGWFSPWGGTQPNASTALSFGDGTTFSGTGLIGIWFNQGNGSVIETVDLTNVTASGLSGQLIVLNNWNNETDVKLLGDTWANVEYLFGNVADDTTLATKYGLSSYTRGDLNNDFGTKTLDDYLALQGNTTLAGVTGASKGATTTDKNSAHTITLADHEFITVASNGQTLTIAGSDTYAFYGTAGTDSARLSLTMNSSDGSGKQTFGGTNYLQNVTVTAGTLALEGVTNIAGSVSVAASSTLELGGEITLSNTITNSGTVSIASDVSITIDGISLQMDESSGKDYYVVVTGGTGASVSFSGSGANFIIDGRTLTDWGIYTSNGYLVIYGDEASNLTWAGTSGNNTWNTTNTNWSSSGGTTADSVFKNGDNVTFNSSGTQDVTISGRVHAGTMEISSGTYSFSSDSTNVGSLEADTLNVSGGSVTFGVSTTIGDFNTATSGSATGNTITLTEGTTVTATSLTNAWGTNFVLEEGSVLTVTGATSFEPGGDARTVSGSGTFSTGSLTLSNYANYTFTGVTFIADTVTMGTNAGSLTFSGASATIGTFNMSSGATVTFTGGGEFTIGNYTESASGTTFAIGEDTTVNVGTFSSSWGETFSFSSGSVLNVTTELTLHTNSMETMNLNGGTLNAEKLNLSNYEKLTFSNGSLNIGSGGITADSWGGYDYLVFGDGLTVGVYAGTNGNTSWSSAAVIQLEGTGTGTTFFTGTDESITITGSISGEGNLTKTGDGTLTVSTYDVMGTTTVSGGTLVLTGANSNSATNVSIANLVLNGGTLAFSTSGSASTITLSSVTVSDSSKIAIGLNANNDYNDKVVISSLSGSGTLSLDGAARTTAAAIFELTGTSSQFTGTISLSDSDTVSSGRGVTLIVSSEKAAAGAVIEMGAEADKDTLALGVNAEKVEIAGLTSGGNGNNGGDVIYSGSVALGATLGDNGATLIDYKNQSKYGDGSNYDGVGASRNTLVINTAENASYSFSGVIMDKLNLEKSGAGTQSIEFKLSTYGTSGYYFDGTIAVTEGTLNLSGVETNSSGITVASGAMLNIANDITLTTASDLSSCTSTISGNLGLSGTLTVASDATLAIESTASVTINSAIVNEGSITIADGASIVVGNNLAKETYSGNNGDVGYYVLISGSGDDASVTLNGNVTFTIGDDSISLSNLIQRYAEGDSWKIYTSDGYLVIYEATTATETADNLYWAGTDGNSTWSTSDTNTPWSDSDTGEAGYYFQNGENVIFGSSEATVTTVTVSGTVEAGSITVNSAYTFAIGDEASVRTGTLTYGEGGSLTLTGSGTFIFNAEAASTVFTINTDGSFTGNVEVVKGQLQLSGTSLGAQTGVVVHASEGTETTTGIYENTDVSIVFGGNGVSLASDITVEGDGGVIIRSGNSDNSGTLSGNISAGENAAYLQLNGGGSVELSGDVSLANGGYVNYQGSTTFSGNTVTLGKLVLAQNTDGTSAVTFTNGVQATVGTLTIDSTGTDGAQKTLTVSDGAALTITTALALNHEVDVQLNGGMLAIAEGATVSSSGNDVKMSVTISDGGQLSLGNGVTLNVDVMNIVLSTENYDEGNSGSGTYVIVGGTGSSLTFTDNAAITITVDSALETLLSNEGTYYFDISNGITLSDENLDWSALERYGTVSWDGNSGILSVVVPIPEPELFSIFFGLGALGLVATRRRRRKVA